MPGPVAPSPASPDRRLVLAALATGAGAAMVSAGPAEARSDRRPPAPDAPDGGVSGLLARHAVGTTFADLGAETVAATKLRVLDLVGCAIGGVRGEGAARLSAVTAARGGRPDAVLLGTTTRVPAGEAAMANATLARAFDFEVMTVAARDRQVPSHHAPTTVMAALAMSERIHADGRAFLTSLCVGDDFAARTLAAAGLDFDDGWDGVPLYATMAAAAIAARFLGLDPVAARNAIALAADQIGGSVQSIWDGANGWKVVQGTAARAGITSAELAQAGGTGMADPLGAPCGFYAQYTPGCTRPDLLTAGLGREWFGEVYFKPYPSCAANHPTIECALTLRETAALDSTDIAAVKLMVAPPVLRLFIAKPLLDGPSLHSQANFNVRFACANALLRGSFRQEHYAPAMLADPALREVMARTTLAPLPAGARGVAIEITRRNGTVVRGELAGKPRHYPDVAGTTPREVEAKFRQQVAFAANVPTDIADEIVRRIAALEKETDMTEFAALVARSIHFSGSAA